MDTKLFKSDTELSDEGIAYVAIQIKALEGLGDAKIDEIADTQYFNPDVEVLLAKVAPSIQTHTIKSANDMYAASTTQITNLGISVNYDEERAIKFQSIKLKVQKIFCQVLPPLITEGGEFDLKVLIPAVVTAILIDFSIGPLGVVLLPFIIAIIIKLLNNGIENICKIK